MEKWGARVGPGSQYFRHDGTPIAPVQVTDSAGWNATFGMHRADFVDFLAKALPADVVHVGAPVHRLRAGRRQGARIVRQWRRSRKPIWWSAPTASIPSCGPYVFPPSRPVFPARSPTGDWWRTSALRIGRPTAGRCGWARASTSSLFRCARASSSTIVGFVPADEEMKESWSAPGDPDMLRQGVRRLGPAHRRIVAARSNDFPLGAV